MKLFLNLKYPFMQRSAAESKSKVTTFGNPFPPSLPIWHSLAKLSILILEGIIKKIPELRDYESVDEKILS